MTAPVIPESLTILEDEISLGEELSCEGCRSGVVEWRYILRCPGCVGEEANLCNPCKRDVEDKLNNERNAGPFGQCKACKYTGDWLEFKWEFIKI